MTPHEETKIFKGSTDPSRGATEFGVIIHREDSGGEVFLLVDPFPPMREWQDFSTNAGLCGDVK